MLSEKLFKEFIKENQSVIEDFVWIMVGRE